MSNNSLDKDFAKYLKYKFKYLNGGSQSKPKPKVKDFTPKDKIIKISDEKLMAKYCLNSKLTYFKKNLEKLKDFIPFPDDKIFYLTEDNEYLFRCIWVKMLVKKTGILTYSGIETKWYLFNIDTGRKIRKSDYFPLDNNDATIMKDGTLKYDYLNYPMQYPTEYADSNPKPIINVSKDGDIYIFESFVKK